MTGRSCVVHKTYSERDEGHNKGVLNDIRSSHSTQFSCYIITWVREIFLTRWPGKGQTLRAHFTWSVQIQDPNYHIIEDLNVPSNGASCSSELLERTLYSSQRIHLKYHVKNLHLFFLLLNTVLSYWFNVQALRVKAWPRSAVRPRCESHEKNPTF